jgi:hypothetical protein
MTTTTDPLDATLRQAADYFGCDRDWLGAQLKEANVRPVRAGRYDLKAICNLLMDDDPRNLTVAGRAQVARTQMLERKDAEQARNLIPWSEAEYLVGRVVATARQALQVIPDQLEAVGITAHKAHRADRHCQSAIREIELLTEMFDKRLAVRSDGVLQYEQRLETDNAAMLARLAQRPAT